MNKLTREKEKTRKNMDVYVRYTTVHRLIRAPQLMHASNPQHISYILKLAVHIMCVWGVFFFDLFFFLLLLPSWQFSKWGIKNTANMNFAIHNSFISFDRNFPAFILRPFESHIHSLYSRSSLNCLFLNSLKIRSKVDRLTAFVFETLKVRFDSISIQF